MKDIISILVAAKEVQGLTNQQLADASGVPVGTVSRVMAGSADDPKFQTICQLAGALQVSLDDFIAGRDSKAPQNPPAEPTSQRESNMLIQTLQEVLRRQQKEKRVLFLCLMLMIAFVMAVLIIDITNPTVGWFRGASAYIRDGLKDFFRWTNVL